MAITVRPITDEQVDEFIATESRHFGGDIREGDREDLVDLLGLERTHAAIDDGTIVGTAASFAMELTVPGASLAAAGLTAVGVASTHRRRGLLNGLMTAHFDHAAGAGEPLSALWASETAIYGRYGYGMSVPSCGISFDGRVARLRAPDTPDELRFADLDEAKAVLPDLHEQVRTRTPGQFHRTMPWWEMRRFADLEWMRKDASPRRTVIARRGGVPVGYVAYRQKEEWTDNGVPNGQVKVYDLQGVDQTALHTLYWFLGNIDLYPNVTIDFDRPDSLVPWLAENYRSVVQRYDDSLWLRILDVERTMSVRRYDAPGRFEIEVLDDRRSDVAGRYRLDIDDHGVGSCERTGDGGGGDTAEVQITAAGLATLYLGANKPAFLEVTGAIRGDAAVLDRFGRSLRWPVTAWCNETF